MQTDAARFDLFPTRVWVFKLDQPSENFSAWLDLIEDWRASTQSQGSSNRSGWTSPRTVFERPEFQPLEQAVSRCFAEALKEIAPVPQPETTMRGWVNFQQQGGFNHFHMHGRAALAGVFYLHTPPGSGDLVFRDPRPGVNLVALNGNGVNCFSVTSHTPQAGEFVVFPGWLEHGTEVSQAAEPRISIAVNCYTTGLPPA